MSYNVFGGTLNLAQSITSLLLAMGNKMGVGLSAIKYC